MRTNSTFSISNVPENRRRGPASTRTRRSGFTLLIAIIFMSVMLAFGLALGTLAYKQSLLASGAVQSQYAFYAADAGLECALHADQKENIFAYPSDLEAPAPTMTCDAAPPVSTSVILHTEDEWVTGTRLSLDSGKRCADVTVYKPAAEGVTRVFSVGYDAPCATVADPGEVRLSARGLQARYVSGSVTQTNPQDGSISQFAATSCQSILSRYPTKPNGAYWINPDGGTAFQTYCDMTTDGGGWTKWAHYPSGGSPFPLCSATNTTGNLSLTLQPSSGDTSATACLPINRVKSIATAGTEVMARNNLFTTKIAFTDTAKRNIFLDQTHQGPSSTYTVLGTASVLSGGSANALQVSTDAGQVVGMTIVALKWDQYMFMGYGPHSNNYGNNIGGVGGGANINQAAAYYIR